MVFSPPPPLTQANLKQILSRRVERIPSFSTAVIKLLNLIQDDQASIERIADIVVTDPALSTRVLSIVNSAAFGSRGAITSIKEAIIRLGLSQIQRTALQVSVFEQLMATPAQSHFDRVFFLAALSGLRHLKSPYRCIHRLSQSTGSLCRRPPA